MANEGHRDLACSDSEVPQQVTRSISCPSSNIDSAHASGLMGRHNYYDLTKDESGNIASERSPQIDYASKDSKPPLPGNKSEVEATNKIIHLSGVIDEKDSQITYLKEENKKLQNELQQAKMDAHTYQHRHASTTSLVQEKERSLSALEKEHEQFKEKLSNFEDKSRDYEHDISQKDALIEDAERAKRDMKQGLKQAIESLENVSKIAHEYSINVKQVCDRQVTTDDEIKAENGILQDQLRQVTEELEASIEECENVRTTFGGYMKEIGKWNEDKKLMKSKLAESNNKYKAETKGRQKDKLEFDRQAIEWNKLKTDLLRKLQENTSLGQRLDFTVPDAELVNLWSDLDYRIGQFVNRHTKPVANAAFTGQKSHEKMWQGFFPMATQLIESRVFYLFVFKAHVWQWLIAAVFSPDSRLWGGSIGAVFTGAYQSARKLARGADDPLMSEIQTWRSSSCNLVSRLSERNFNFESLQVCSTDMIDELLTVLPLEKLDKESAHSDALGIVTKARNFDIIRRKLRAQILIKTGASEHQGIRHLGGFKLRRDYMKDITPRSSPTSEKQELTVLFCVTPGLLRYGLSDGTGYDNKAVLGKMSVICEDWHATWSDSQPSKKEAEQRAPLPTSSSEQGPVQGAGVAPKPSAKKGTAEKLLQQKCDLASQGKGTVEPALVTKQECLETKVKLEGDKSLQSVGDVQADGSSTQKARTLPAFSPACQAFDSHVSSRSHLARAAAPKPKRVVNDHPRENHGLAAPRVAGLQDSDVFRPAKRHKSD